MPPRPFLLQPPPPRPPPRTRLKPAAATDTAASPAPPPPGRTPAPRSRPPPKPPPAPATATPGCRPSSALTSKPEHRRPCHPSLPPPPGRRQSLHQRQRLRLPDVYRVRLELQTQTRDAFATQLAQLLAQLPH